jgi:3',5'-cyclic-AMP phosphodiesterase
MNNLKISRRGFITRAAILTGGLTVGFQSALAGTPEPAIGGNCRFVFATDSHLMVNNKLRSEDGIVAALSAIEQITPKPDFILFGGDLTHESPELDFPAAEQLIDRFLKIWRDQTGLETYFTFGNHDLVGTKNATVDRADPRFGKGLYKIKLSLDRDFYTFRKNGWRFIVLDDVVPEPDGSYIGEFALEQLAFLRDELNTDSQTPTILCGHIPFVSVLPNLTVDGETKDKGTNIETPSSLVVHNTAQLHSIITETKANVKALLAGHLHHLEQIQVDGISYINSGAVCGNWWKGAQKGCPEGFLVVDLSTDGGVLTNYHSFGWKAAV